MVPSHVQLPNSDSSQIFEYQYVKDHEEEGGGHVGELGDHEGVGILYQFFSTWLSRPP